MNEIIEKTAKYVTDYLNEGLSDDFLFHNLEHVEQTVSAVNEIGENSGLNESDLEVLNLAAWLHDIGHVENYDGHEDKSIELATGFLKEQGYPEEKIQVVNDCINATKMDVKPANLLQEIICDADIINIGRKGSIKKGALLRQEWERILGRTYTDREWLKLDIDFYTNVKFYTRYVREKYDEGRLKNISRLKKKLK